MSRFIDLTGQKFGRLTVLEYVGKKKWRCQCSCGKIVTVCGYNLTSGHTASCGCKAREQSAKNGRKQLHDLAGKRFGKLTALEYDIGKRQWLCKCDCGNMCYVSANNLTRKKRGTISCGCAVELDSANAANIVYGTNVGNIMTDKPVKRSKTGVRGVYYSSAQDRYYAAIGFRGRQYYITSSEDISVCVKARKEAEKRIFGDFLEWLEEYKMHR